MKRTVIKIDENLCNGCGICVEGCHEGALQLIDGKATMVSELYCDGLGACIGECPVGAITLEEREALPYDERKVMDNLIPKGMEVVRAHFRHLADHNQQEFIDQGVALLNERGIAVPQFQQVEVKSQGNGCASGGCPGSRQMSFAPAPQIDPTAFVKTPKSNVTPSMFSAKAASAPVPGSELRQWPVQLHLLSPTAPFLEGASLLVAADCCAYAMADFHSVYLKGKMLAIACPKLDTNQQVYVDKLVAMIDKGGIDTITVMIMEVPCCNGLLRICREALSAAERKVPLKLIRVGVRGDVVEQR